jgi:hypothetical protein
MSKRILLVSLILGIIGLALAGCMRFTTLVVTPTSAIVEGGGTVTFAAADSAGTPATVTAVTNATITATQVGYVGITSSATVTIEPPEPPAEADLVDAVGDASAWIGTAYDVKGITTSLASTTLTVSGGVATPAQLAGFLCFDTNESTTSGWPSPNSLLCPSCPTPGVSAIGVDYFVDLFSRDSSGNYSVYRAVLPATATLAGTTSSVSVAGNVLTLVISLTALGGDDGITGMNALLGNGWGPTDCVPDSVAALVTGKGITPSSENSYLDFLYDTYGISWGTSIAVTKTAYPISVQSGSTVTFTVSVENTGDMTVILTDTPTTLVDNLYGDLTNVQTTSCMLPQTIEVGDTYTCTYEVVVTGSGSETDVVTATATDVYGAEVAARDTATVTITP